MALRGKALLALMLGLLIGLVGACGGGGGQGSGGGGDDNTITIGYIDGDEDVAVTNLAAILLEEERGYNVETTLSEVGPLYSGVATGDLDAFLDVWLPNTPASYWEEYQDEVVDLGQWYEGSGTRARPLWASASRTTSRRDPSKTSTSTATSSAAR